MDRPTVQGDAPAHLPAQGSPGVTNLARAAAEGMVGLLSKVENCIKNN